MLPTTTSRQIKLALIRAAVDGVTSLLQKDTPNLAGATIIKVGDYTYDILVPSNGTNRTFALRIKEREQ